MTESEFIAALQKALTYEGNDRPALVARIPVICNDIRSMQKDISNISDNLKWGVRIVIGAVITGLLMLLFK